MSMIHES